MDEITQKNIILVITCIIVICFHFAYKFKNNLRICNILLGIAFVLSLITTWILNKWEKENKVDYNLVLFLYILVDLILFLFLVYRYCDTKFKMTGGGNRTLIDEFKEQDFMIREVGNSKLGEVIGNKIKERLTDYIVGVLSRIRI